MATSSFRVIRKRASSFSLSGLTHPHHEHHHHNRFRPHAPTITLETTTATATASKDEKSAMATRGVLPLWE